MPIDVSALKRCWDLACEDAGLSSPAEVRLYYLPGGADLFQGALHLHPGSFAAHEDRFPFTRGQVEDANQVEHRELHRIAIRDTPDEPTAVALLRHELEHARQHRASLPVYNFMAVAEETLSSAFRDAEPPTLEGSALLYNFLPHEMDANRAASACARRLFGHGAVERAAGPSEQLFRETGDPHTSTLAPRLVAVCAIFPVEAAVATERLGGLPHALATIDTDLAEWWSDARAALGLESVGRQALEAIPTRAQVDSTPTKGEAWRPALDLLVVGYDQALASIETGNA
jgi:hypothetical protein